MISSRKQRLSAQKKSNFLDFHQQSIQQTSICLGFTFKYNFDVEKYLIHWVGDGKNKVKK